MRGKYERHSHFVCRGSDGPRDSLKQRYQKPRSALTQLNASHIKTYIVHNPLGTSAQVTYELNLEGASPEFRRTVLRATQVAPGSRDNIHV